MDVHVNVHIIVHLDVHVHVEILSILFGQVERTNIAVCHERS